MMTLRNVLRVNALSSGLTGLLLAFFPRLFSNLFEVNIAGPFIGVGVFLIVFAIAVGIVSLRASLDRTAVIGITLADAAWVVASVALVLTPVAMSFFGKVIVLAVAGWVLLMAALQYRGVKEISSSVSE